MPLVQKKYLSFRYLPVWSDHVYARVERREIAYVKFILESYDNLAFMSVIDKYEAILKIIFAPGQRREVLKLLYCLGLETGLTVLNVPYNCCQTF